MRIILEIKVYSPNDKVGLIYTKEFESSVIPTTGALIQDPIFAKLKPITSVVLNYFEDTCLVKIEDKEMPNGALDGHVQEVAELHNWKQKNS